MDKELIGFGTAVPIARLKASCTSPFTVLIHGPLHYAVAEMSCTGSQVPPASFSADSSDFTGQAVVLAYWAKCSVSAGWSADKEV